MIWQPLNWAQQWGVHFLKCTPMGIVGIFAFRDRVCVRHVYTQTIRCVQQESFFPGVGLFLPWFSDFDFILLDWRKLWPEWYF